MEKSRSLFQQVTGHKMLFVVFLLFPTDILIEGHNTSEVIDSQNVATNVSTTASLNISNSSFVVSPEVAPEDTSSPMPSTVTVSTEGKKPHREAAEIRESTTPLGQKEVSSKRTVTPHFDSEKVSSPTKDFGTGSNVSMTASLNISNSSFVVSPEALGNISMTPVTSPPDATMNTSVQPASSLRAAPPVSKQELHSSTVMNAVAPEDTSSPMPSTVTVSTEGKKPHREAVEIRESTTPLGQKEVSSKRTVTPHFDSEKVSSPTKDFGTGSQGSFLEQSSRAIAYTETTKSTEPKQGRKGPISPGQAVPELTQTPETGSHHPSGPFTTSVTSINNASKYDTADQSSSKTNYPVIILVVVVSILLLVGLLAFLYFRRRRHSGSTSFNTPEWPGQATLPDDTGLDKDMEQQAGAVGEGETRRGTLVTFFGKRQSRVPSIAMEDMNGKGGKGETEQLLCGEAETGSTSQATGDANGKVPEPLKESP